MKKKAFVVFLAMFSMLLVGCGGNSKEIRSKELIFVEKTKEYDGNSFIFESESEKQYYIVEVSSWQYDNVPYQKGEEVELNSAKVDKTKIINASHLLMGAPLADEEVKINDKWTYLFKLTDYTKTE